VVSPSSQIIGVIMTVHCFIEQKDGTRHSFGAGCFGWMDVYNSIILRDKAPKADYKETGAKVGYTLYFTETVNTIKYLEYLKNAKLLQDVEVTKLVSDETNASKERIRLEAVCSNELPGQEIVGKFELLRHLESSYYKTLVQLAQELELYKKTSPRYEPLSILLTDYSLIVVAMYITRWFVVSDYNSGLPDCMPGFPSKSFLNLARNCEDSRKLYKGWKDSSAFSGVYRYFSNALVQEMTAAKHSKDPLIFKNKEDIKHTYLHNTTPIKLSVKDAVRVFSINCPNITRY
jgi:hypothetical protein